MDMVNYIKIIKLFIKVNLKIINIMDGESLLIIKDNSETENMMDMEYIKNTKMIMIKTM